MVEKHETPVDLYYQHNSDECVFISTPYVIKLSKFDDAVILKPTDLGDGVVIGKVEADSQLIPDNSDLIHSLLGEYGETLEEATEKEKITKLQSILNLDDNKDKLNMLSVGANVVVSLEKARASGQPIYCLPSILFMNTNATNATPFNIMEKVLREDVAVVSVPTMTKIKKMMASDYGRIDFLSFVEKTCLPDSNPFIWASSSFIEHKLTTEIAQVLMENTLKSLLEGLLLCFRYYKTSKEIFYLLLMGGLLGFYQNEMLIACGVTFDLKINWEFGDTARKAVPGFKNKYQWVFLDMVKRTENVVKTLKAKYGMNLP
jgi:hypothetical protein